jgi:hypothetical protein
MLFPITFEEFEDELETDDDEEAVVDAPASPNDVGSLPAKYVVKTL